MRIFVSYTTRDGCLSQETLVKVDHLLREIGEPYIDLLHNVSSAPQAFVEVQLRQADVVLSCVTPEYDASEWARRELALAAQYGIPIVRFDMRSSLDESLWATEIARLLSR